MVVGEVGWGGLGVMVGQPDASTKCAQDFKTGRLEDFKTLVPRCHGATVLDVSSINISGVWDCGSVEVWECGTVSVTGHGGRWFQCPPNGQYL